MSDSNKLYLDSIQVATNPNVKYYCRDLQLSTNLADNYYTKTDVQGYVSDYVHNAKITIKQGGTYKGSFTLNQSTSDEINLDVGGTGTATWGSIGGTLSDQPDLSSALGEKADKATTLNSTNPSGNGIFTFNGIVKEGKELTANGSYSHAQGIDTTVNGNYSHAEGSGTIVYGMQSHAEGYGTVANGNAAHAQGSITFTSGWASHAEGTHTLASGNCSHAQGYFTSAYFQCSHAEGCGTVTNQSYQHVQGKYNDWESLTAKDIFVIGGGTSDTNRKNAFVVKTDGNATFSGIVTAANFNYNGTKNLIKSNGKIDSSFIEGAGTVAWGNIDGTLSNQPDLYNQLSSHITGNVCYYISGNQPTQAPSCHLIGVDRWWLENSQVYPIGSIIMRSTNSNERRNAVRINRSWNLALL